MTFVFSTIYVPHLGRRTRVWCRLCKDQIAAPFAHPGDARAEADIHLRKFHRDDGVAA